MADLLQIGIVLSAIDNASRVITGFAQKSSRELTTLSGKIQKVSQDWAQMGREMATASALQAAALTQPIRDFMALETAQTDLASATLRAGGVMNPALEQLHAKAVALGNTLPGTTADFERMMTMLTRQGMSSQKILNGMAEATAYLAVQLHQPPEAMAEFVSNLQDATQTADAGLMSLVDTVQRAYYIGVDIGNMREAFAGVAPALRNIGMQGEEGARRMAPLITMLDQASLKGGAAGNALGKIFSDIFDSTKLAKANAELKGTGIALEFIDRKTGQWKGLDHFLKQMERLQQVKPEQRLGFIQKLFGDDKETKQAIETLVAKGTAGYAEMTRKMTEQANLQERIKAQLGTLQNLWDALTGTITNLSAAMGALWGPELKAITITLNEWAAALQQIASTTEFDRRFAAMKGVAEAVNPLRDLIKYGFAAAAVFVVLKGVVGILMWTFGGLGKTLVGVWTGLTWIVKAAGWFLTAGRYVFGFGQFLFWIGRVIMAILIPNLVAMGQALIALTLAHPVIALIVGIAVAAMLLYRNWEKVSAVFRAFFNYVGTELTKFVADFKSGLSSLVSVVTGLASQMYNAGANLISQLWEGMKAKFAAMKAWLSDSLSGIGSWMIGRSPPPAGPLHRIDVGGANIMAAWLHGMQRVPVSAGVRQMAGRAAGGFGGGAGRGATITFAPQITITGGGAGVREQVQQGLRLSMRDFEALMARYQAQQRRLAYADVG